MRHNRDVRWATRNSDSCKRSAESLECALGESNEHNYFEHFPKCHVNVIYWSCDTKHNPMVDTNLSGNPGPGCGATTVLAVVHSTNSIQLCKIFMVIVCLVWTSTHSPSTSASMRMRYLFKYKTYISPRDLIWHHFDSFRTSSHPWGGFLKTCQGGIKLRDLWRALTKLMLHTTIHRKAPKNMEYGVW